MKYFFEKWGVGKIFSLPQLTLLAIALKSVVVVLQDKLKRAKFYEEYVLLVCNSKKNLFKGG